MLGETNLGPGPFPKADPGLGTRAEQGEQKPQQRLPQAAQHVSLGAALRGERRQKSFVAYAAIPMERSVIAAASSRFALS